MILEFFVVRSVAHFLGFGWKSLFVGNSNHSRRIWGPFTGSLKFLRFSSSLVNYMRLGISLLIALSVPENKVGSYLY